MLARRIHQPHGMHHHASHVGLAVQTARMSKQIRQRHEAIEGERDQRHPVAFVEKSRWITRRQES